MSTTLRHGLAGIALVANAKGPAVRHDRWSVPSFAAGWITTEAAAPLAAVHAANFVRGVARGDAKSPLGKLGLASELVAIGGLTTLFMNGRNADVEFEAALADVAAPEVLASRPPGVRLGAFVPVMRGDSKRKLVRAVAYGDKGWRNKLDVYMPKRAGTKRPIIVQIHGGGWTIGNKNQQGIPLLNHMADQGWVGFNINYRLAPKVKMIDQVEDCKRAIAWIREHAEDYGGDPDFIAVTGGSAGGHLSSLMAVTGNEPDLQPGFEDKDTSIQAAVPFYGVYDIVDRNDALMPGFGHFLAKKVIGATFEENEDLWRQMNPFDRITKDAPPMMLIHGSSDSLVQVEQGRAFAQRAREVSDSAVVYAELKGANHAFDIFPSPRSIHSVEFAERFLTGVHDGSIK